MRTLVVYAHPSPTSFCAAVDSAAREALAERGHSVDACDLYAEGFDPVLPPETFRRYLDAPGNRAGVERYVDRLLAAEALVFVFPVWHDGPPAILKGFFDRTFLRGVVFEVSHGVFYPRLHNIQRLTAVALYGADLARTRIVGDLPRRFVKHNLGTLITPGGKLEYLAAYGMDGADADARKRFLRKVRRSFLSW